MHSHHRGRRCLRHCGAELHEGWRSGRWVGGSGWPFDPGLDLSTANDVHVGKSAGAVREGAVGPGAAALLITA